MNRTLVIALLLAGCGRELSPADVKTVGVGLDPDEIGPEAEYFGGVVEYAWIDYAGGLLPLALTGLVSYDPVGPELNSFKAPYAMVYGVGFVMDQDMPAPDALLGTFAAPPKTAGTCQTVYEAFSFVNQLADVGNTLEFNSADGKTGISFERTPSVYPPDARDVFSYYFGLETWRPEPQLRWATGEDPTDPAAMTEQVLRRANFGFGQEMTFSFPGGAPPSSANVGSIPMPLASLGEDRTLTLPNRPEGVRLSWKGPQYDADGDLLAEEGEVATCLQYGLPDGSPATPADCLAAAADPSGAAQVYTGPWDTLEGVLFQWTPPAEDIGETVSVTVRFLAPVDRENEYLLEGVVYGDPSGASVVDDDGEYTPLSEVWAEAQSDGDIPADASIPEGRRPALTCEEDEDVSWVFDDAYVQADGSLIPSLQGDPSTALVEVTCTLPEQAGDELAEFLLTEEHLADALAYARLHGSEGAVFYFTRSSSAAIQTPPVRDAYGKRRDISPLLVVSRAVQLGRFWYEM